MSFGSTSNLIHKGFRDFLLNLGLRDFYFTEFRDFIQSVNKSSEFSHKKVAENSAKKPVNFSLNFSENGLFQIFYPNSNLAFLAENLFVNSNFG